MGKHSINFIVMVRPRMLDPEMPVGFPYVDKETAEMVADEYDAAGNYSVRVAAINPITGKEIPDEEYIPDCVDFIDRHYNNHSPLV